MKNLILILLLISSVFAYAQETICGDGIDNDGDGFIDCFDQDCNSIAPCPDPIPCTNNSVFYQVREADEFVRYDPATQTYFPIFQNAYKINAIGYNVKDGYIYGIRQQSDHLVRVGADGIFDDLGSVQNLPDPGTNSFYTGDFDLLGNYYVTYGTINTVYRIDVSANPPTATGINMMNDNLSDIADFSFLPATGLFYGLNGSTEHLFSFNPSNGDVQDLGTLTPTNFPSPLNCATGYGASFADNSGNLYFFCNSDGNLYEVDPDPLTMTVTLLQATGISLSGNDGAACALSDSLVISQDSSAYCCDGDNLIENGNFEGGDTGFFSEYNSVSGGVYPGEYAVIDYNDASSICSTWNVEDHTHCVNGSNNQILIVNGQTQQNANTNNVIWQSQSIQVEQDSQYKFCAFVKHLQLCCFDITPEISIEVRHDGGTWINNFNPAPITYTGSDVPPCDWEQIGRSFTAVGSTVEIRILIDELGNGDGNDLALDDISLMKLPKPDITFWAPDIADTDPLPLEASIYGQYSFDDILPDDSCKYVWAIVEIVGLYPTQLNWSQTIINGWYGGSSPNINNNWGLTTNFPGISIPGGEKVYRIYLGIVDCECSANELVFVNAGGGNGFRSKNEQYLASKYQSEEEKAIADYYINRIVEMGKNNANSIQIIDDLKSEMDNETLQNKFRSRSNNSSLNKRSKQIEEESDIQIYPNPFSNQFRITFDDDVEKIELYNSMGKNCTANIRQEKENNEIFIDGGELPSGIYFVKIGNESESFFKVIKINSH